MLLLLLLLIRISRQCLIPHSFEALLFHKATSLRGPLTPPPHILSLSFTLYHVFLSYPISFLIILIIPDFSLVSENPYCRYSNVSALPSLSECHDVCGLGSLPSTLVKGTLPNELCCGAVAATPPTTPPTWVSPGLVTWSWVWTVHVYPLRRQSNAH